MIIIACCRIGRDRLYIHGPVAAHTCTVCDTLGFPLAPFPHTRRTRSPCSDVSRFIGWSCVASLHMTLGTVLCPHRPVRPYLLLWSVARRETFPSNVACFQCSSSTPPKRPPCPVDRRRRLARRCRLSYYIPDSYPHLSWPAPLQTSCSSRCQRPHWRCQPWWCRLQAPAKAQQGPQQAAQDRDDSHVSSARGE
jgi:hypothetical protein